MDLHSAIHHVSGAVEEHAPTRVQIYASPKSFCCASLVLQERARTVLGKTLVARLKETKSAAQGEDARVQVEAQAEEETAMSHNGAASRQSVAAAGH